jgi:hypothetical protein
MVRLHEFVGQSTGAPLPGEIYGLPLILKLLYFFVIM